MIQKIDGCSFLSDDQKTAYKKQATESIRTMIKAYVRLGNDLKHIFSDPAFGTLIERVSGGYASYGETGKTITPPCSSHRRARAIRLRPPHKDL